MRAVTPYKTDSINAIDASELTKTPIISPDYQRIMKIEKIDAIN